MLHNAPNSPKDYDHRGGAILIIPPRRGVVWICVVFCHDEEQPAGNPKTDDEQVEEDRKRAKRLRSELISRCKAGDSLPHSDRERDGCLRQYQHHVSLVCFFFFFCPSPATEVHKKQVLTMLRASPLWPCASFLVTNGSSVSSGLRIAPCHLRM